jgi:hypothetical protein
MDRDSWIISSNRMIRLIGGGISGLHLGTLGIINGCIDAPDVIQSEFEFVYNNTYGIQSMSKEDSESSSYEFSRPGGVLDSMNHCREMARQKDPHNHGDITKTNQICLAAEQHGRKVADDVFNRAGRSARFDVTHEATDPFPPPYMFGWLNQAEVQKAFGVPVNHTWASSAVEQAFDNTGDFTKGGQLDQIRHVLDHGVSVALFHGDRHYACNWVGGEKSAPKVP